MQGKLFQRFNPPRILKEHWCIYSCLQIPSKENWFQYVHRVYTTAFNFPCITSLKWSKAKTSKDIGIRTFEFVARTQFLCERVDLRNNLQNVLKIYNNQNRSSFLDISFDFNINKYRFWDWELVLRLCLWRI